MQHNWQLSRNTAHSSVYSAQLAATGLVLHGVTTREVNLNLSFRTEPDPERVRAHRAAACALFGASLDDLVVPEQVHAAGVSRVDAMDRGRGAASCDDAPAGADALVTDVPGLLLGITVADCLSVFLLDPVHRAIGLAHSGWRGTAGQIVPKTLEQMRLHYGTALADVLTAIGPGIGGDCYEVGAEVVEAMRNAGAGEHVIKPSPAGRWLLDLQAAVTDQLLAAGVKAEAISAAPWCTHCSDDLFFSHRRDGAQAGRMGAFLMLK